MYTDFALPAPSRSTKYWRLIFSADSIASLPPLTSQTCDSPAGAIDATASAASTEAFDTQRDGWANSIDSSWAIIASRISRTPCPMLDNSAPLHPSIYCFPSSSQM